MSIFLHFGNTLNRRKLSFKDKVPMNDTSFDFQRKLLGMEHAIKIVLPSKRDLCWHLLSTFKRCRCTFRRCCCCRLLLNFAENEIFSRLLHSLSVSYIQERDLNWFSCSFKVCVFFLPGLPVSHFWYSHEYILLSQLRFLVDQLRVRPIAVVISLKIHL